MKDLEKFRTSLNGGLARANLMDVVIQPPLLSSKEDVFDAEFLTFRCENADLPGKSITTNERKDYVVSSKHPSGLAFTDLTLTFVCSSSMKERIFFDKWMEKIVGTGELKSEYYDKFISPKIDVSLYTGDSVGEGAIKSATFTYHKIFPIAISEQDVNWGNNQILKLTIGFSYEYWSVQYFGKSKK